MTQVIVRTVPDRGPFLDYITRNLPNVILCVDEDTETECRMTRSMNNFFKALKLSGDQPTIHIEDDIILTVGFEQKAQAVIESKPDNIIQFFSMRKKDISEGSRWDSKFAMNQCFYLPSGYGSMLLEYGKIWPGHAENPGAYDYLMNDWLRTRKEKYWLHVPNLVDHRVAKSVANSRRSAYRTSLTFQDPIHD